MFRTERGGQQEAGEMGRLGLEGQARSLNSTQGDRKIREGLGMKGMGGNSSLCLCFII